MIKSAFIFSMLLSLNVAAISNKTPNNFNFECEYSLNQEMNQRASLLGFNVNEETNELDWNTINLIEIEEDVELDFDTKKYLPKNFNPLKGMFDLDWDTIELVELEEEVELNFDTKVYLPKGFNAYKGMCAYNKSIDLAEL